MTVSDQLGRGIDLTGSIQCIPYHLRIDGQIFDELLPTDLRFVARHLGVDLSAARGLVLTEPFIDTPLICGLRDLKELQVVIRSGTPAHWLRTRGYGLRSRDSGRAVRLPKPDFISGVLPMLNIPPHDIAFAEPTIPYQCLRHLGIMASLVEGGLILYHSASLYALRSLLETLKEGGFLDKTGSKFEGSFMYDRHNGVLFSLETDLNPILERNYRRTSGASCCSDLRFIAALRNLGGSDPRSPQLLRTAAELDGLLPYRPTGSADAIALQKYLMQRGAMPVPLGPPDSFSQLMYGVFGEYFEDALRGQFGILDYRNPHSGNEQVKH